MTNSGTSSSAPAAASATSPTGFFRLWTSVFLAPQANLRSRTSNRRWTPIPTSTNIEALVYPVRNGQAHFSAPRPLPSEDAVPNRRPSKLMRATGEARVPIRLVRPRARESVPHARQGAPTFTGKATRNRDPPRTLVRMCPRRGGDTACGELDELHLPPCNHAPPFHRGPP